jgi:RNA 2',3'-cyclic 3'-phosphodiesterase
VRAFIAVEIPRVSPVGPSGGSPPPDHLTLRFLGDIEERTANDVIRALGPFVVAVPRFEIVVEGIGAFPSEHRPRVVWRGVTQGSAELQHLAHVVRAAVESAGVAPDPTPFVPHVTLFRVRSPRDLERANRLLRSEEIAPPSTIVPVGSVEFVESQLLPRGAVHRTRASVALGGELR